MATVYLERLQIPENFENLLQDLIKEILREQPEDLLAYCHAYFLAMRNNEPVPRVNSNNKFALRKTNANENDIKDTKEQKSIQSNIQMSNLASSDKRPESKAENAEGDRKISVKGDNFSSPPATKKSPIQGELLQSPEFDKENNQNKALKESGKEKNGSMNDLARENEYPRKKNSQETIEIQGGNFTQTEEISKGNNMQDTSELNDSNKVNEEKLTKSGRNSKVSGEEKLRQSNVKNEWQIGYVADLKEEGQLSQIRDSKIEKLQKSGESHKGLRESQLKKEEKALSEKSNPTLNRSDFMRTDDVSTLRENDSEVRNIEHENRDESELENYSNFRENNSEVKNTKKKSINDQIKEVNEKKEKMQSEAVSETKSNKSIPEGKRRSKHSVNSIPSAKDQKNEDNEAKSVKKEFKIKSKSKIQGSNSHSNSGKSDSSIPRIGSYFVNELEELTVKEHCEKINSKIDETGREEEHEEDSKAGDSAR